MLTWTDKVDEAVDAIERDLIEVRRYLHQHPELSGHEIATTGYIAERLKDLGLTLRFGEGGRGLIVDPPGRGGKDSPIIAIRADIDALKIEDAKEVSYRSRVPNVMHACGHDGHTAVVLGALLALHRLQVEEALPCPVNWRAIFQPAEETNEGALEMIRAGALDGVRAILGLHMDPARPLGSIGLRSGPLTANCDGLDIAIQGKGGHAARPHESVDPIAAAAQMVSSLYLFIPRRVNAQEPVVVTIGQIQGGETPNAVPDRVLLRGTLRSLESGVRQQTKDHIRQLARGLAETSGTDIDVAFREGPPAVINDPDLIQLLRQASEGLLGDSAVLTISSPSMGGEDFAQYLFHAPGAMFRLGCGMPGSFESPGLHSPSFDLSERAITIGAKVLTRAVIQWSQQNRAHC